MGLSLGFFLFILTLDNFHRHMPLGGFGGPDLSPQMCHANWMSLVMMVTLLAWMAHMLLSSKRPTKYGSDASCKARIAPLWNLKFILKS